MKKTPSVNLWSPKEHMYMSMHTAHMHTHTMTHAYTHMSTYTKGHYCAYKGQHPHKNVHTYTNTHSTQMHVEVHTVPRRCTPMQHTRRVLIQRRPLRKPGQMMCPRVRTKANLLRSPRAIPLFYNSSLPDKRIPQDFSQEVGKKNN